MRSERNSLSFIFLTAVVKLYHICQKALSYTSKSFIKYMEKLYDYCQKIRIQREKILISVYKNFIRKI